MTSTVNPRLKSLDEAVKLQFAEVKTIALDIDKRFRANERKLFATEGASGGSPWKPLSEKYRKRKKKKKPGRKIMAFSGATRKSLTTKGSGHVLRYNAKPRARIDVGTSHITPAYHLEGPLKNPNVPERDTLQTTDEQFAGYRDIISRYLRRTKWPRVQTIMNAWARHRGVA